jgi:hypothetical protein
MGAGILETFGRIMQLGGTPEQAARVAEMRARFEVVAGPYAPEDAWFEERSRAFWCDAVTRQRFGREVAGELSGGERAHLVPLERAHRGLFRAQGEVLQDLWSGAEFVVTELDETGKWDLDLSAGQLVDARLAGTDEPPAVALLPGAIFHPREATPAIERVLGAARAAALGTHDVLDALLRMERNLRALARVKVTYAYRPDALVPIAAAPPVRRGVKAIT